MNSEPKKILLIKPGAIGDLLHISPTVHALKKRFPDAGIDIMVSSRGTVCLFENSPHIRKVLYFDRKGEHRAWSRFRALWQDVRREGYDLVINFQRSTLKVWLLVLAAFPCRVLVYHKTRQRTVHAVSNHLETVAPLGIDPNSVKLDLEMFLSGEDEAFAEKLIADKDLVGKRLLALNLGASHAVNRWPVEHFAALADLLFQESGVAVLLVGGSADRELADRVRVLLTAPVVDLVGKTSLLQLGAVLQRCEVVVSGDTGPMHLATAVGTPVVALFGAADPRRTGPVGNNHSVVQNRTLECVPCCSRSCSHTPYLECMTMITVEEVMQAVRCAVLHRKTCVETKHVTGRN